MNCPNPQQWDYLSMNMLDSREAENIRAHAATCSACRQRLKDAYQESATLQNAYVAVNHDHAQQREHFIAALTQLPPPNRRRARTWRMGDYLMSLNTKRMRIAAMVSLPAACLIVALTMFSASPHVAFADVVERMKQAKTMTCHAALGWLTSEDEAWSWQSPASDGPSILEEWKADVAAFSNGDSWAWRRTITSARQSESKTPRDLDFRNGMPYYAPGDVVIGDSQGRHYIKDNKVVLNKRGVTENLREECDVLDIGALLVGFQKYVNDRSGPVSKINIDGRDVLEFEIDGKQLGIHSSGPIEKTDRLWQKIIVHVWADANTWLPVQIEFRGCHVYLEGGENEPETRQEYAWPNKIVWSNIRWDEPVDPVAFQPPTEYVISGLSKGYSQEDEDSLRHSLGKIESITTEELEEVVAIMREGNKDQETQLIEYFRDYAELANLISAAEEKYKEIHGVPCADCSPEMHTDTYLLLDREAGEPSAFVTFTSKYICLQVRLGEDNDKAGWSTDLAMKTFAANQVFTQLESMFAAPKFYENVKIGDPNAVLMEWTTPEHQQRVIFGDLRIETH